MSDEQNNENTVETPGPLLKAAREQAGLTTQQVAQRLNLRHSVVQGMEDDSFEPGTSVTYIRGYVRNYARLVGLDEARLNQALDALHQVEATPNMQSFSRRTNQQKTDNRWMMATWIIAAGIVGLVIWWWLANEETRQLAPQNDTAPVSTPAESGIAEPTLSEPEPNEPDLSVTDEPAQDEAPVPVQLPEPAPEDTPEAPADSNAQTEADEPAAVEIQDTAPSGADQSPTISDAAPSVPAQAEATEAALNRLAISLSSECWMLVQDANGNVLLEGLKLAGYTTELEGEAPFSLRLGAPEAVSLVFDGEAVDLSSFRAGRVARLTLPQ
ncbi:cytoskeleton protein RodZ [Ferrimonas balearica]|uniref:cytoskeleton protein RodZ n=1 Tax=Ferrimonas balearica TaxID=44012 RepID=UPI001C98FAFE|nr:cytoskeleton protein RodZ [Ferrimonas balearica]MBY5992828.1 cytoskeleton protein RodZ [Ferrimonas balearica]